MGERRELGFILGPTYRADKRCCRAILNRSRHEDRFDLVLQEIEEFVTGERGARTTDRVLATILFTDIVGSTSQVATLGDERWREMRAAHHEAVRRELERFRGREVDTAGDGFFATFDGPGRAIRCAQAIGAAVRRLGLEVRAGVHTGECEIRGAEVSGIAVHIGARVMALAGPSEVLVSQTVKDLWRGAASRSKSGASTR
jgi:class 3 adenylate cyclase